MNIRLGKIKIQIIKTPVFEILDERSGLGRARLKYKLKITNGKKEEIPRNTTRKGHI